MHGEPTGCALEIDAVLSLVNAVDPISPHSMHTLLETWLPKASAAGITSVFDAGVPPIAELEQRGKLPFRVVASYSVKSPPVDDAVTKLTDICNRISTDDDERSSPPTGLGGDHLK